MRRSRVARAAAALAGCAILLTGCGGDRPSGNIDVVLVDTSNSFCGALPNCHSKINGVIHDSLADLSKSGGALRLVQIGSDTGSPGVLSSNPRCTGVLRGAAACFSKPSLWGKIFGSSGTQKKAALKKIETDIAAAAATPPHFGTSIFDAIVYLQPYLNDRRLDAGQSQLVILSDMIEEGTSGIPPLTCANVGTPEKDAHLLSLLRDQGRLPDLHYVIVEVFGANARHPQNGRCRDHFWHTYFARTGAELMTWQPL
jgi:hypothetical protein